MPTPPPNNPFVSLYEKGTLNLSSDHMHVVDTPFMCVYGGCVSSETGNYIGYEARAGYGMESGMPPLLTRDHDGRSAKFNLIKFDAAELFLENTQFNATSILVYGTKSGPDMNFPYSPKRDTNASNRIIAKFDLEDIRVGVGGVNDFQTFFLPSSFTDLSSVVFIPTHSSDETFFDDTKFSAFAFDNIVVTAVPEPSTITLFSLGLASLWYFRRRSVARKLRA